MGKSDHGAQWSRLSISRIEDLRDAIHGAGLDAFQISKGMVSGSLAYGVHDDVTYNTGRIVGHVAIRGVLSEREVTLGLGLVLPPGSRQWFTETLSGDIGVFFPSDDQDALYESGSMYATATLSFEHLEERAANIGVVLDRKVLRGSGVTKGRIPASVLHRIKSKLDDIHIAHKSADIVLGEQVLDAIIQQLGREPHPQLSRTNLHKNAQIVSRAREYIFNNLEHPLSIKSIAAGALTTRRSLHRAFVEVLNETPYNYVLKLRLHRIRCELLSDRERRSTITSVASRWGVTELGRFSKWYGEHFGELPSQTMKK